MYQFEKDVIARAVAESRRQGSRKRIPTLVREAVRGKGITRPSDVKKLTSEISAILGEHGQSAQAAARMRAKQNRRAEV